jgi:hypothetical protein
MSAQPVDKNGEVILDTMAALAAMEDETLALLKLVGAKTKLKKTKSLAGSKAKAVDERKLMSSSAKAALTTKDSSIEKTTTKRMAVSQSVDSGLGYEKTKDMFADRATVEIFDDASPDVTPRMDNEARNNKMKKIEEQINNLKKTQNAEQAFRKMNFEDEHSRVSAKRDIFVPGPTISGDDVKSERDRLNRLEESARAMKTRYVTESTQRTSEIVKNKAVTKMQALFRGHVGRMKFTLTKRLKTIANETVWVEVKDRQTDECWYYNTITGESQWDRPDELLDVVGNVDSIKKLPVIRKLPKQVDVDLTKFGATKASDTANAKTVTFDNTTDYNEKVRASGQSSQQMTKTATYMAEMEKQEEDERSAKREINELMGFDKLMPAERMIAPDGKFKPQLRATILDTLNQTRFDSVSSVLADPRWMEADADLFLAADMKAKKAPVEAPVSGYKLDPSRRSMATVMVINQRKPNPKQLKIDSTEEPLDPQQLTTRELTVRTGNYPGFDTHASKSFNDPETMMSIKAGQFNPNQHNMCFGCWSAGFMKSCAMHEDKNSQSKLKKSQTLLLCRNWDLGVMRRRYRAEEIQEVFLKTSSSLRYDPKRKVFSTVFEIKHPVYRWLNDMLSQFNNTLFLMLKIQRWLRTFTEDVRRGNVNERQRLRAELMKQKRNKEFVWMVHDYFKKINSLLPMAPFTGSSWPERIGEVQYLFNHPDPALGMDVELILVDPIPVPKFLYLPREYHLSVPRNVPMPKPAYSEANAQQIHPITQHFNELHPGAWLERLCASVARDSLMMSQEQVTNLTPVPGLEMLRRSKQPPPCTIKFATLGRKPTPGNLDVGSLPMELLTYQLISTYFPPQYGNFMVMDKSTVSPGISAEVMIRFESLLIPPALQPYVERPIEHPLNYRRAPSISVNSYILAFDAHYYGSNRPDQTGEQASHGFRTSAWTLHLLVTEPTDALSFIPNADVVSLNNPSANRSNSTHADLTYPFCNPSSRDNSTLDFYHLLLCGSISKPHAQVCTALTIQEPGSVFKDCRDDLPMGRLAVSVYRSWAFTQKDKIQEFKTDEGIPYWYHRETGQSFWERPLHEEEEISILRGGVMLDMDHDEMPTTMARGDDLCLPRHTQGEFRKIMLNHHETDHEAELRRKRTTASAKIARRDGALPNAPPGYEEAYDGSLVPVKPAGTGLQFQMADGLNSAPGTADGNRPPFGAGVTNPMDTNPLTSSPQKAGHGEDGHKHHHHHHHGQHGHHGHHGHHDTHGQQAQAAAAAGGTGNLMIGFPDEGSQMVDTQRTQEFAHTTNGPAPGIFNPGATAGSHGANLGVTTDLMTGLTQNLGKMMAAMLSENITPQEMIQLGMGMGMTLLQSGAVQGIVNNKINPQPEKDAFGFSYLQQGSSEQTDVTNILPVMQSADLQHTLADPSSFTPHSSLGAQPIGVPNPTVQNSSTRPLDKQEQLRQVEETASNLVAPYTAMDKARNLSMVGKATLTPDEAPKKVFTLEVLQDAEERIKKKQKCLVYPELSSIGERGAPDDAQLHPSAGLGTSYLTQDLAVGQDFVPGSEESLRKLVMPLPVGFFNSIVSKKVAKQEVDYLPKVPNLPQSRTVGRVKPRSAATDWLAVSFDPWSAGKNPLNTEFVSLLASKAEKFLVSDGGNAGDEIDRLRNATVQDAYVTIDDNEGVAKQRNEISKAQIIAEEFKRLCSLCRHGKFVEVEQMLNRPDWNVPIDHQDTRGNCLLHIAAQNGNIRLVKLCLRRGAAINIQNLNGQTPLHFAFGFGFKEVGDYMLMKGGDDTIRNRDGLTCYEGLGSTELANL